MTITRYKLISNEEVGFAIIKNKDNVRLFIDKFEGGEAYELDFTYVDEFDTKEDALSYIVKEYGEVEEFK